MDALLNAMMAIGLLLILVLVIYLIDKVNAIERETRKVMTSMAEKSVRPADPFLGLGGKKLWDAMTGRSPAGLDANALEGVRQLYQVVLSKHMEALYREGFNDGQRGMSGEPKNTRQITTAKGQVESWIPSAQANTLYQCGLKAADVPPAEWGSIRAAMDEAGLFLLSKTQLDTSSPLSDWLMPQLAEELPISLADANVSMGATAAESGAQAAKLSPP